MPHQRLPRRAFCSLINQTAESKLCLHAQDKSKNFFIQLITKLKKRAFLSIEMSHDRLPKKLSVIITVVSGYESTRKCLQALMPQTDPDTEIIVPFDEVSKEIESLRAEFPRVRFLFIENSPRANERDSSINQHYLYDKRRAAGLCAASGEIIAMTEDHARPASDWCRKILEAHRQTKKLVIGGAIENGVDALLNRAWYYCDFGRYGKPLSATETAYVSDVNVSYKRAALDLVKHVWSETYQETTTHWALQKRGVKLYLDEKILVFQHRPKMAIPSAWRERFHWGKVFAETRAREISRAQRLKYAAGCGILPFILLIRAVKNMRRQNQPFGVIFKTAPLLGFLLAGWSAGEAAGYLLSEKSAEWLNYRLPEARSTHE